MSGAPDQVETFEREGLLDGLEGRDREARLALLQKLAADGFAIEELKRAAAENRLGLLPIDRVLAGEARYTPREIAERSGLPLEFLMAVRRAIGLAVPEPDDRTVGDEDLEAAIVFARLRAAGLPDDGLLEVTRVLGTGLAQGAEAMRMLVARWLLPQGVDEHELSSLTVKAARELLPLAAPLLQYTLTVHMRDQLRNQQYGLLELSDGASTSTRHVFVGFADLVGFTWLGERIDINELGRLLGRLTDIALEAVRPPTRLVVTDVARPGSVLATRELREAVRDRYRWSDAGEFNFKGLSRRMHLYRVRRPVAGAGPGRGISPAS